VINVINACLMSCIWKILVKISLSLIVIRITYWIVWTPTTIRKYYLLRIMIFSYWIIIHHDQHADFFTKISALIDLNYNPIWMRYDKNVFVFTVCLLKLHTILTEKKNITPYKTAFFVSSILTKQYILRIIILTNCEESR